MIVIIKITENSYNIFANKRLPCIDSEGFLVWPPIDSNLLSHGIYKTNKEGMWKIIDQVDFMKSQLSFIVETAFLNISKPETQKVETNTKRNQVKKTHQRMTSTRR